MSMIDQIEYEYEYLLIPDHSNDDDDWVTFRDPTNPKQDPFDSGTRRGRANIEWLERYVEGDRVITTLYRVRVRAVLRSAWEPLAHA